MSAIWKILIVLAVIDLFLNVSQVWSVAKMMKQKKTQVPTTKKFKKAMRG